MPTRRHPDEPEIFSWVLTGLADTVTAAVAWCTHRPWLAGVAVTILIAVRVARAVLGHYGRDPVHLAGGAGCATAGNGVIDLGPDGSTALVAVSTVSFGLRTAGGQTVW